MKIQEGGKEHVVGDRSCPAARVLKVSSSRSHIVILLRSAPD
jgi:hypothetical protein